MLRMATVVSGANVMPMPAPATMAGTRKVSQVESGPATTVSVPNPMAKTKTPVIRMYLPPTRSAMPPGERSDDHRGQGHRSEGEARRSERRSRAPTAGR